MNKTIKCMCGCGYTLYVCLDDKGKTSETLFIGVEKNAKKGFKNFQGLQVNRKELIKLLK